MRSQQDKYENDATAWCQSAENFRAAAYLLFRNGNPFLYFPAAILGHFALEMFIKAALIRNGHRIDPTDVWGHDLPKLLAKLASGIEFPELVSEAAETFNIYFEELRYPREADKLTGLGEDAGWLLEDAISYLLPYAKGPKLQP